MRNTAKTSLRVRHAPDITFMEQLILLDMNQARHGIQESTIVIMKTKK